jgi:ribosomal protein S27AE
MKHTVSPEAKQKLYPIIRWLLDVKDMNGMPTMNDVEMTVEKICEWYEAQASFTDHITVEAKVCPTCGQSVVAKKIFMKNDLVWTLKILYAQNRPMNMKMVAKVKEEAGMPPQFTKDQSRHILELRYWGLIDLTGVHVDKCELVGITTLGRSWVADDYTIPAHVYVFNGEVVHPVDGDPAQRLHISEVRRSVKGMDFADRMKHWEQSIGMLSHDNRGNNPL